MCLISEHCSPLLIRSAHFSLPRRRSFTALITSADLPCSAERMVFLQHPLRRQLDASGRIETSTGRQSQTRPHQASLGQCTKAVAARNESARGAQKQTMSTSCERALPKKMKQAEQSSRFLSSAGVLADRLQEPVSISVKQPGLLAGGLKPVDCVMAIANNKAGAGSESSICQIPLSQDPVGRREWNNEKHETLCYGNFR